MPVDNYQIIKIKQLLREGKTPLEVSIILHISPVQVALVSSQNNQVNNETPPVSTIGDLVLKPLGEKKQGDILIGITKEGEQVFWNPTNAPNPHLMIVGGSGFGKTYGIIAFICEISRTGLPTIVIDYSRGYERQCFPKTFQGNEKFNLIDVATQGISLNPLEIRESDIRGPLSVAMRIAGTFNRIYNIGIHQHNILRDVIIDVYSSRGICVNDPLTWNRTPPYLTDVQRELQIISEDTQDIRRKVAEKTYNHISNFFAYNTFNPEGLKFNWGSVINSNKVTVLQLYGLDGKVPKIVTEFLLWDIYGYISSKGPRPLNLFLVLDEAHNLSFKAESPVDKIVREARKFGLGIILASQQPEDFSGPVFGNTGTKICYQVSEDTNKFVSKIASKSKQDPSIIKEIISTLEKKNAFVLADNKGYICKILSYEERGI
jgi:DNA phosphorothioation-dependent restriction protein DptH